MDADGLPAPASAQLRGMGRAVRHPRRLSRIGYRADPPGDHTATSIRRRSGRWPAAPRRRLAAPAYQGRHLACKALLSLRSEISKFLNGEIDGAGPLQTWW